MVDLLESTPVKAYLVGGAVREIVRGFPEKVKDWDFAVEAESFDAMRNWLELAGFEIFLETPQYFTIRARAPKDYYSFAGLDMTGRTFDFTLCRSEGEYTDGRHPDSVQVGTIKEDLARRDFTMNAIALDAAGGIIDPFGGAKDIKDGLIRCVGTTERLREDALRMLRAIRFAVQLDFTLSSDITQFLYDPNNVPLLDNISEERIREELTKCFKADTLETLYYLQSYHALTSSIFGGKKMWLLPTVKG
jgi:tRNA nucleotidyltransferase (CCA-adding enzyme)